MRFLRQKYSLHILIFFLIALAFFLIPSKTKTQKQVIAKQTKSTHQTKNKPSPQASPSPTAGFTTNTTDGEIVIDSPTPDVLGVDSINDTSIGNLSTDTLAADIPTPTSGVSTPTPSPTEKKAFDIHGENVDENNNPVTLSGQKIVITKRDSSVVLSTDATPTWSFTNLDPGIYDIIANGIAGYSISYSLCDGCTSHSDYKQRSKVFVALTQNHASVEVYFKYSKSTASTSSPIPLPTEITPTP